MAPNIYVFWKLMADPPAPWTRLSRTDNYIRFVVAYASHMQQIGAATHTPTVSTFSCGNAPTSRTDMQSGGAMGDHNHSAPPSGIISSNTNNPPYYALDIIYMDLGVWQAYERRFPAGSILVSNAALATGSELSRFSAADGYYIVHGAPGTTGGTSTPQSHRVQGTLPNVTPPSTTSYTTGSGGASNAGHGHTVDLNSDAKYSEPRNLITRLYEALIQTSKALQDTVVFVDADPGTTFWEVLTGWANANFKAGNSDPTITGSDTHSQTASGNSSSYGGSGFAIGGDWGGAVPSSHAHYIQIGLNDHSHVPLSRMLIPVRLKTTLLRNNPSSQCVMC